jgi:hypothetical protein
LTSAVATVTNLYGGYIEELQTTPTGDGVAITVDVTNAYGIKINDINIVGTNNYAIKTGLGIVDLGGGQRRPLKVIDNTD